MALRAWKIKQKAERHPDYPRRPSTPYSIFLNDMPQALTMALARDTGSNPHEIRFMMDKEWKKISEAELAGYNKAAAGDKIRYEKEMKVFEAKHPDLAC